MVKIFVMVCALLSCLLSGAALAVSLSHAGPPGRPGAHGVQGPAGPQGPAGDSGTTPYSSYNEVCSQDVQNTATGVVQLYYYPCTNGVQPVPGT